MTGSTAKNQNFRGIVFFIFGTFVSLFSCSYEGKDSVSNIQEDLPTSLRNDCSSTAIATCTNVFSFNGTILYEGCPISYTVTYAVCGNRVLMQAPSWVIGPSSNNNCKKLRKKIFNTFHLVSVGNAETSILLNQIEKTISLDAEQKILIGLANSGSVAFGCGASGSTLFSIEAFSTDCINYCITFEKSDEGEDLLASLAKNKCGDNCCIRRSNWCLDYSVNPPALVLSNTTITSFPSTCSIVNNNCPNGFVTTCTPPCDRL